jgi:type IV pilus assembly protein PilQ
MMSKHVPVVVATCVLLGSGLLIPAADAAPIIQGLRAEAGTSGAVIHLRASDDLETVHYSPQPGVWVVEMPEAAWDGNAALLEAPELGIERAELSHVEEFGKRVSRLTVWLTEPGRLLLIPVQGGLDLEFASLSSRTEPEPVQEAVQKAVQKAVQEPVQEPVQSPADFAKRNPEDSAADFAKRNPEDSAADFAKRSPEDSAVPMPEPDFTIPEVVVEQPRVKPSSAPHLANASSLLAVTPVRAGGGLMIELEGDTPLQAESFTLDNPDRLVIDLPNVINRVDRHLFSVNTASVRQVRVAQNQATPVPITRLVVDLKTPVSYTIHQSANGAMVEIGDSDTPITVTGDGFSGTGDESGNIDIAATYEQPIVPEPADEVPAATYQVPPVVEQPETAELDADEEERSPFVADVSQLIERAPAAQVLDPSELADEEFQTTEVTTQEQQFTGEPITLTLKDADVKDVLRTFSALTQLNIVLDPSVGGSVTVELREVPWDQALDLILRINGLDYVLENNVLRVAPISKLQAEQRNKADFEAQAERAKPLKTVVKPLSYAKASYVSGLLSSESYLLSDRGSVVVDERTNKLIIRDVVDRVEGILRLIDTLDQPTPQVVIEGRIVETTRDFSRELGVNWGFSSVMDAAHGNDTGLEFPNSVEIAGDVVLPRGDSGILSLAFGDILNTFNLDFVLTAAEADGIVKIVSTPRVTTQNLMTAQIRSGLQIPVQTVANNTVTVQYVDATLRLEVTPQITAEGTVNLDLDIRKQEPVLAAAVIGGQNVPIFTRDATTQLLVRDGGTTVIAGIYQINDQDNENRIPGLHKIPIFGHLFKNKGVFKRHDELLIFITPRIVKY